VVIAQNWGGFKGRRGKQKKVKGERRGSDSWEREVCQLLDAPVLLNTLRWVSGFIRSA
jgi:hypothetical protein